MEQVEVAVVGGGQAGLAVARELGVRGVEHVVLERGEIGQTWRERWDSFCLVTPNWSVQLPGYPYDGDDPDGYMVRDDIVSYLERYASSGRVEVRTGVDVRSIDRAPSGGFALDTSTGELRARTLILATGAYQRPHRPAGAGELPSDLLQIDVTEYFNPGDLPVGRVLVIGSGQSGCQLAEELHQAGRDVVLSCGRAPWVPRRLGGKDVVWWASETGFLDAGVDTLPNPGARLFANFLTTGHGGGHDLHLRTLRGMGVSLTGHFLGASNGLARFAADLVESVAWGDERYRLFMDLCRNLAAARGLGPLEIDDPAPFAPEAPEEIGLSGFGTVLFAGGFRPDYGSCAPWPEAFDELGFPIQRDGVSTVIDGLYFVGLHFLRTRKSSILLGVGEDAEIVARAIADRRERAARTS